MKLLSIILFIPAILFAQQDPKAKEVLDLYAAKHKSITTYKTEFTINTENKQDSTKSTSKGSLTVKGKMYKLILPSGEIITDGQSMWNYLKDANEVNITKAGKPKKSREFSITDPTEIFTLYQKDFKYRYINQIMFRGKECHEIDLYPKDLNTEYFRIKLFIDKLKNEMIAIRYYSKDGIIHEIIFTNLQTGQAFDIKEFQYDPKTHPGAEVNDMRF